MSTKWIFFCLELVGGYLYVPLSLMLHHCTHIMLLRINPFSFYSRESASFTSLRYITNKIFVSMFWISFLTHNYVWCLVHFEVMLHIFVKSLAHSLLAILHNSAFCDCRPCSAIVHILSLSGIMHLRIHKCDGVLEFVSTMFYSVKRGCHWKLN